jgi:hypothetical protein
VAEALGVKDPHLVPQGVVKLLGKKVNPISRSQRVSNARFKQASGWTPRYEGVFDGWPAVVAAVRGADEVAKDG